MEPKFTRYKELIELQLEELTADNALGQSAQKTVKLDQQSVGRLSRMDALQSQTMAQVQQKRRDVLKGSLQAALQRLKEDEFGYCLECGDEIEEARLLANSVVLSDKNNLRQAELLCSMISNKMLRGDHQSEGLNGER